MIIGKFISELIFKVFEITLQLFVTLVPIILYYFL